MRHWGKTVLLLLVTINFTNDIRHAKVKEKKLVDQFDIFNLVENSDLNTKLATLTAKTEQKQSRIKPSNLIVLFKLFSW